MLLKSLNRGAVTELSEMNSMYHLNLSNEIADQDGWDYNCMGFALGTYEWDTLQTCEDWDYNNMLEEEEFIFPDCIDELLSLYDDGRGPRMRELIHPYDKIEKDEYRIAFRLSDDDFHFLRQMEDGVWYEKCGADDLREVPLKRIEDDWISPNGCLIYTGHIAYFAVEVA